MKLSKEYIRNNLSLSDTDANAGLEAHNGLLTIQIDSTDDLNREADRIRSIGRYRPHFYGDNVDDDGWYNYFVYCEKDKVLGLLFESVNMDGPEKGMHAILLDADSERNLFSMLVELVGEEEWKKAFNKEEEMEKQLIGENIRYTATLRGFTQRDLARKVGMSEITISRYLRGIRMPNATALSKISSVLHVSADYLLGKEKDPGPATDYQTALELTKKNAPFWTNDQKKRIIELLMTDETA